MDLVSLEDAKDQCAVDTDAYDRWFRLAIAGVSAAVRSWLKQDWRLYEPSGLLDSNGDPIPAVDSSGDAIVSVQVQRAVLVEVAMQFRSRDGIDVAAVPSHWGHGYVLGAGATSLLSSLRKSTVQ